MDKLQELKKKYKELGEEIERLENQGKVWEPEEGEQIYYLLSTGSYDSSKYGNLYTKERYTIGNCFKTVAEVKAVAEKIQIYTELKRLAEEINTEPVEWGTTSDSKYKIIYDWTHGSLQTSCNINECHGGIYSTNKDFLKIAKERIGEDRLLKLFKED